METNRWKMMAVTGFAALGGVMWSQVLAPRDAVGYPSGAAVSYGSNPVFSVGGYLDFFGATDTLSIGLSGHDAIVTDVVLTTGSDCNNIHGTSHVEFRDSTNTLAWFAVGLREDSVSGTSALIVSSESGIRVAEGESLTLQVTNQIYSFESCPATITAGVFYTLSGYYAEP